MMNRELLVASLLMLGTVGIASCNRTGDGKKEGPSTVEVETVMKKVYPALVRIFVVTTRYGGGREVKGMAAGSGVIISPEGHVVTNHHVVGHATKIWCSLHDHQRVDAELVGTDPLADIAVFKLLPESMRKPVESFPCAAWGDSDSPAVGQKVFAMGSPGAITQSVTYGVIANPGIVLPGGGGPSMDGEPVGILVKWILHDAQIYGGNSGGPLVDVDGRIIGINEIGVAGLGGAIPAKTASRVAGELIENGAVRRSWVGAKVQKLLRSDEEGAGVLVGGVVEDSPAEKAGLQPGDRILKVGGEPIDVRYDEQMPEFHRRVLTAPVGSTLALVVERGGEELAMDVETVARGRVRADDEEIQSWGVTARDLTMLGVIGMRYPDTDGVLVSSIRPGGPAGQAKPKLGSGDVIRSVGGRKVRSLADLLAAGREIAGGKEKPVPTKIDFWRRGEHFATVVAIGPEKEPQVVPQVRKAWFPASVQVLTRKLAEAMNMAGTTGVRITRLYEQLADGGFAVGDVITRLDRMPVDACEPQHAERFPAMIRRYKPGTSVTFKVLRGGKKMTVAYTLPRAPVPSRELPSYEDTRLELEARDLGVMDRIEKRLPVDQEGTLLEKVTRGGWAHLGGLRAGDIVLGINGKPVRKLDDLKTVLSGAAESGGRFLVFFVKRNNTTLYAEVEQEPDSKEH